MRIISIKKLKTFWESGYADAEQPLKVWNKIFNEEEFKNPQSIKKIFPSCSFINNNRVIFNISGNKYRLVAHFRYDLGISFIRFIGTHAEYDKINANEV